MKELIEGRDVNPSELFLPFYFKPDGDAETREPMKIIGCPVEGIDNPLPWRSFPLKRTLFCQNIMLWKTIRNHFYNGLLTAPVSFRHRVEFSFVLYRMGMAKMEHLYPARLFGSCDG